MRCILNSDEGVVCFDYAPQHRALEAFELTALMRPEL
jgi:hypothetical protein